MTIPNRTVTMNEAVFASNALTTIPQSPVAGTSYRNTSTTKAEVQSGFPFKTIVDSAKFNQYQYLQSYLTNQLEKYGFMPWSNLTDYVQGSCCLGSNGIVYRAKQSTGPSSTAFDPVNDTANTYWESIINRFITVASLPANPDPFTYYFVKETV